MKGETGIMHDELIDIIERALAEDIGRGDLTSDATVDPAAVYTGRFVVKATGVIAGLDVMRRTLQRLDPTVAVMLHVADGASVVPGDVVATVSGPGRALLSGERVALNFMQRMSGIATATRRMVAAVGDRGATILDTRKTAPGLRLLDKMAVRLGGGANHRFGLDDMALIKENHIVAAGGITAAVAAVRAADADKRPIEVEVTTLDELREALTLDVDRIMLDNMTLDEMRAAVALAAGRTPLEASGNVTQATVAAIAATGVDYISSGALTHSVTALDISFLLHPERGGRAVDGPTSQTLEPNTDSQTTRTPEHSQVVAQPPG